MLRFALFFAFDFFLCDFFLHTVDVEVCCGAGSHSTTHTHSRALPLTRDQPVVGTSICTTQNIRKRQTSMPPAGFDFAIPASEGLQTHALDREATAVGHVWLFIESSGSRLGASVCLLIFLLCLIVCNYVLRFFSRKLHYHHHHHHHHHHISVMELGHLLTRSALTYPEVSS